MIETGDIQVIIEDGTNANLCQQIAYIKAGKTEIEDAVQEGIGDFNTNATEKTNTFNNNASEKTTAFNDNAIAKTSGFNSNATSKTNDFNYNASNKTSAFNDNYLDKKALIDAEVQVAKDWATKTDGTVDGVDYSAKYYAQSILPIKDDITAVAEIATDVSDAAEIKDEVTAVAHDKENVDAVAENINNVNTVAGDHANIQTVVNNMTAINNAPTYANNSKIWAEGLDGEVAPLGGTHSSKGWAEIAEQAASGVQNPANRDLSNLTNTGQMIIDSQNGTISNCILEIPQNIKISISNNVITLESGSVVALTGYNTYTTRTTTANITKNSWVSSWYNKTILLYIGSIGTWFGFKEVSKVGSGSSLPADNTNFDDFYLTTDYSLYEWENGTWSKKSFSYPLAIVNVDSNGVPSFAKDSNGNDMIFNGAGFIGHHAFVYPNVKGLTPNGFNDDGSLKSDKITTNALRIYEISSSFCLSLGGVINTSGYYYEQETEPSANAVLWYKPSQNIMYRKSGSGVVSVNGGTPFILAKYNGTTVTDFAIQQPYEGARNLLTDELEEQIGDIETALTTIIGA